MGTSNKANRVEKRALALLAGCRAERAAWSEPVFVNGQQLSPSEILLAVDEIAQVHQSVRTHEAARRQAVKTRNRALTRHGTFLTNLEVVVRQTVGNDLKRLARYGLKPIKRRGRLSPQKQVIAKVLEAQTRAARGTKGSKQRLAITTEPKPRVVIKGPDGKPLGK